jgi:hypothetical protein
MIPLLASMLSFCAGEEVNERGTRLSKQTPLSKAAISSVVPEVYTNLPYVVVADQKHSLALLGDKFPDQTNVEIWGAASWSISSATVAMSSANRRTAVAEVKNLSEGTHDLGLQIGSAKISVQAAVISLPESVELFAADGGALQIANHFAISASSGSAAIVAPSLILATEIDNTLVYPFSITANEKFDMQPNSKVIGPVDIFTKDATLAGTVNLTGADDSASGVYLVSADALPPCSEELAADIAAIKDRPSLLKFMHKHLTDGSIAPMRMIASTVTLSGSIVANQNPQLRCHPTPVVFMQASQVTISGSIELYDGIVFISGKIDSDSQARVNPGANGIMIIDPNL